MIYHCVVIVVLGVVLIKLDFLSYLNYIIPSVLHKNEKTTLLVGVLSGQTNFRARNAIRETWGQIAKNHSMEVVFLVGDEVCPYPVEDRVTPYGCNLWLINLTEASDEYSTVGGSAASDSCDIGFTFIVKTRILLQRIGLDYVVFSGNTTDKARVILYNSRTGQKMASATFLKEQTLGFIWKPIAPLILEKGFEGELKLVTSELQTTYCNQALQYFAPVYYFETFNTAEEYTTYELGDFRSSVVGLNYSLEGVNVLEKILIERSSRFQEWELRTTAIKQQLKDEQQRYRDILFLSGFVDVYDNLSIKISVFFSWVKIIDSWKYVLKTDDDVFLDLARIEKGLQGSWDLWTCMRVQPPNLYGKWRDRSSKSYPPFPSGSGYVLSRRAVKGLKVHPLERLGEDVMIGYALGSNVRLHSDSHCCWACGPMEPDCEMACNTAQLKPNGLKKVWEMYTALGRIPKSFDV